MSQWIMTATNDFYFLFFYSLRMNFSITFGHFVMLQLLLKNTKVALFSICFRLFFFVFWFLCCYSIIHFGITIMLSFLLVFHFILCSRICCIQHFHWCWCCWLFKHFKIFTLNIEKNKFTQSVVAIYQKKQIILRQKLF